jgi:hypothetical protein
VAVVRIIGLSHLENVLLRRRKKGLACSCADVGSGRRRANGSSPVSWHRRFCASVSGLPLSQPVEQNQYDDADPGHEDREHDNQLLAIHTFLASA